MKTVYLAGPMTVSQDGAHHNRQIILAEWRKSVMGRARKYKYTYPEMAEEYEYTNGDGDKTLKIEHIPQFDIELIRKCDLLVAYVDDIGRIGTFCEISAAYALGKEIKLVYVTQQNQREDFENSKWEYIDPVPWFIQDLLDFDTVSQIEMIAYKEGEQGRPEGIPGNMEEAESKAIEEIVKLLGGDSINYYEYIRSPEWKAKADAAKERAHGHCQVCYKTGKLDAHHRTYERLGNELPEDITVLCRDCHSLYEKNRIKNGGKR